MLGILGIGLVSKLANAETSGALGLVGLAEIPLLVIIVRRQYLAVMALSGQNIARRQLRVPLVGAGILVLGAGYGVATGAAQFGLDRLSPVVVIMFLLIAAAAIELGYLLTAALQALHLWRGYLGGVWKLLGKILVGAWVVIASVVAFYVASVIIALMDPSTE